jgi:hypothetical protein
MAEGADDNTGDGEKIESETAKSHDVHLPMVVSPKLGAGDEEVIDEPAEPSVSAPASQAQSARFLMLAATVAFAAAFGSFVGSVSGSGMVRYLSLGVQPASQNVSEAVRTLNLGLAELTTIKAGLYAQSHNIDSQMAKIAERLDKLDQHAAADTTGSISNAPVPTEAKLTDRILQGWVVHDVQNGRALVESRSGGIFDVGAGSILPGVGRVDAIKRQDGQWIVVTARGAILSGR